MDETKKHGNTGKKNALRGGYDGGSISLRVSQKQMQHLDKQAVKKEKQNKADVIRALIDDDIKKQEKNK